MGKHEREAGDVFDGPERFRPRPLLRPDEYRHAEISEHFRHGMRDEDGD